MIDVSMRFGNGETAARGKAALVDGVAVIDQVVTQPDHRRRGLGQRVMAVLADEAVRRGATEGILVATQDGLGLYAALGWTLRSPVTAAFR